MYCGIVAIKSPKPWSWLMSHQNADSGTPSIEWCSVQDPGWPKVWEDLEYHIDEGQDCSKKSIDNDHCHHQDGDGTHISLIWHIKNHSVDCTLDLSWETTRKRFTYNILFQFRGIWHTINGCIDSCQIMCQNPTQRMVGERVECPTPPSSVSVRTITFQWWDDFISDEIWRETHVKPWVCVAFAKCPASRAPGTTKWRLWPCFERSWRLEWCQCHALHRHGSEKFWTGIKS